MCEGARIGFGAGGVVVSEFMDEVNFGFGWMGLVMKMHGMRVWGLFLVVLVAGLGFGVGEVEACSPGYREVEGIRCSLTWEGQNLPECLEVRTFQNQDYEMTVCSYEAWIINNCGVDYKVEFHCSDVVECPESEVLAQGKIFKTDLGLARFGEASEPYKDEVVIQLVAVGGPEGESADDFGEEDVGIAVAFTAKGTVDWYNDYSGWSGDCGEDDFFGCGCGVAPVRPVGGFVGLWLMVMGLGVVVWRRRVLG